MLPCAAFQGILTVKSEVCQSSELLSALFHHECSRVIADRFVDGSDTHTFNCLMEKVCVWFSSTSTVTVSTRVGRARRHSVTWAQVLTFSCNPPLTQITVEDHGRALTEHAQWDGCFVDFLREAPEAAGDEPEDTEPEAPKVSRTEPCASSALSCHMVDVVDRCTMDMIDRYTSQSRHWTFWRSGCLFSSSSSVRR